MSKGARRDGARPARQLQLDAIVERGAGLAFPVTSPNHEGSSKGIYNLAGCAARRWSGGADLAGALKRKARIPTACRRGAHRGSNRVGFIEGVGHDDGLLTPVEVMYDPSPGLSERGFNIYDYRLKNVEPGKVQYRCPANLPRDVAARLRSISSEAIRVLGLRDLARLDYRVTAEGRIYLLEANALPALASSSSLFAATAAGRPDLPRDHRRHPQRGGVPLRPATPRSSVYARPQGATDPRRLHHNVKRSQRRRR
jgi:D-alanine-D-alanine ligase